MQERIAVSVVVASHARPLRLRWLLNALEEQTLDPSLWQVLVVHDYDGTSAERVLRQHPLYEARRLREIEPRRARSRWRAHRLHR